ncbi:MAG: hypothetical protein RIT45_4123 [Pseudomonadota bacterium]|jgi:endonuclease/exonuclease/phosphatase family metal-dependent hydrolase
MVASKRVMTAQRGFARWAMVCATAVALLTTTGCGTEETGAGASITLATWNVGLAYNFVALAIERREAVAAAVAATDADVLCLQEVWTPEDIALIETAAKGAGYAHVLVEPMTEDTTGLPIACTPGDTADLAPCANANCKEDGNLVACVQSKCGKELAAISGSCLTCLAGSLTLSLDQIFDKCTKAGGKFSWGGHHGLMLVSKVPFAKTERTALDSTLVQRAVLHATLDASAGKPALEVYCTHLTAGLSSIKYTGTYSGWEAEQAAQIEAMGKHIDASAKAGTPVALLGDLNCGPDAGTDIKAEMPANWAKVVGLGFVDAWLEGGSPKCTFCGDNTLVVGAADAGGEASVIDHIALRGFGGTMRASRIHDGKVTVQTGEGAKETHLSDHFGLRVELEQ